MNIYLPKFLSFLIFSAIVSATMAQSIDITGPSGSGRFGRTVTVLTNGNYVVVDSYYDDGAIADAGAVYLFNGITHTIISTLKGSTANNLVGFGGIVALSNGSFLVSSLYWDNGAATNAGAVTWVNGVTGLNAVVNGTNSLIGSQTNDNVGLGIYLLSNGNYVVSSTYCNNGAISAAGAITWGNASTGISGVVSTSNSLLGTVDGGLLSSVTPLTNGNYVIDYPRWNGDAGAAIWCNGTTGRVGTVNAGIALVGNTSNQLVGGVTALSNGNYVVTSFNWSNGSVSQVGAVTLCNGASGTIGVVSASNSLIGSTAGDLII